MLWERAVHQEIVGFVCDDHGYDDTQCCGTFKTDSGLQPVFCLFLFVCFVHVIIPWKFGPLYLGKTTAAAREQRYPVLVSCSHGIMTMIMILQSLEKLQNRQRSTKIPSAL